VTYRVTLFNESERKSSVREFLDKTNDSLRAKILRQFSYVQTYGLTPAIPNLRKLTGTPIWELRILGKSNVRILCFQTSKTEIVILHIFTKKTQKTPQKEIRIALKRYQLSC